MSVAKYVCESVYQYASVYSIFSLKTMNPSSGWCFGAAHSLPSPQASQESTKGASQEPGIYCNGTEFMEMWLGTPCQARGAVIIEVNLQ